MNAQATQLLGMADRQMSTLIGLLSGADDAALHRPCPDRETLGDGTVAAVAQHTADNYLRIAAWLQATADNPEARSHARPPGHGITPILQTRGHGPPDHATSSHRERMDRYSAQRVDLPALLDQLSTARSTVGRIGELTDQQLDTVPPASDMKFCDGQRTLEQILAGLLRHQGHQIDTAARALA